MKIGILYNMVERVERGFEIDKLSDRDILNTVENIKKALEDWHEVIPVRISRGLLTQLTRDSFDFVFNLCEGIDGNVKGETWVPALFDIIEIPYTGSDSMTLGLCLDKIKTKQLLIANNIPTPEYRIFYGLSQALDSNLNFPLIVKPSREDASVGITADSVVNTEHELFRRVEFILKNYHQPALVEEFIDGRELSVALIGNGDFIEIFPVSEVVFDFDPCIPRIDSYESKWITDSDAFRKTSIVCQTELPEDIERRIKKIAVDAFNITGCRDYATVDFRLKDKIPYVLEVNPNPGIGNKTSFSKTANIKGMSYNEFINQILSIAMKRYNLKPDASRNNIEINHTGSQVIVSSLRLEHTPILKKWFNDSELCKYMAPYSDSEEYSEEKIIEDFIIANHGDIDLIISEKESKKDIGYCSIYDINRSNQSAEISILIGEKEFQGKGYGTEAVKIMLDTAFNKLGLNRVFATATRINKPSIKILEQTGFRRVGVMREYHFLNEEKLDEVLFEMINSDYMRLYKNILLITAV